MIEVTNSGSFLNYSPKDDLLLQRAARYINIKMSVAQEHLPQGMIRKPTPRIVRIGKTYVIEVLSVYRSSIRKELSLVGILGVRITGRKEELVWIDYSDCLRRTISVERIWKSEKILNFDIILQKAYDERFNLTGIIAGNLNSVLTHNL